MFRHLQRKICTLYLDESIMMEKFRYLIDSKGKILKLYILLAENFSNSSPHIEKIFYIENQDKIFYCYKIVKTLKF